MEPQRDPEGTLRLHLLRIPSHTSLPWVETHGVGKGVESAEVRLTMGNFLRIIYTKTSCLPYKTVCSIKAGNPFPAVLRTEPSTW